VSQERLCADCAKTFFAEATAEATPECPKCGSTDTSILVRIHAADEISFAEKLTWKKRAGNTASARRDELVGAVGRFDAAASAGDVLDAQRAVKQALEAIHEQADCASRNEWSQASWGPSDIELWRAHIGARNAAHHTSTSVVAVHSDGDPTWDMDATAVASLNSKAQQAAYNGRLAGKSVRSVAPTDRHSGPGVDHVTANAEAAQVRLGCRAYRSW
jgi:DNA-directed RNA polymerase subunit RPC12/RpoP